MVKGKLAMSKRIVVDADELKDWIKKEVRVKDLSDGLGLCKVIFADDFERALSQFPGKAVEIPEVKHGKWNDAKLPIMCCEKNVDVVSVCSWCGIPSEMGKTPFCPYCGAKMDVEEW